MTNGISDSEASRGELGIGAEIESGRSDDGTVVRKDHRTTNRGRQLAERLRGRGDVAMRTEEIMAITREPGDGRTDPTGASPGP